jgi:hypothetical protein
MASEIWWFKRHLKRLAAGVLDSEDIRRDHSVPERIKRDAFGGLLFWFTLVSSLLPTAPVYVWLLGPEL